MHTAWKWTSAGVLSSLPDRHAKTVMGLGLLCTCPVVLTFDDLLVRSIEPAQHVDRHTK